MALIKYTGAALLTFILVACGGKDTPTTLFGPVTVARFAYVPNQGDNTVSIYTVNASTGQLRPNGYVLGGNQPGAIAITPNGKFGYAVNKGGNDISAYSADANTGALTALPACVSSTTAGAIVNCSSAGNYAAGSNPVAIAIDPDSKFAYISNNTAGTISAFSIDQSNGILYSLGNSVSGAGTNPATLTVDSTGKYLYVANGDSTVGIWSIALNGSIAQITGSPFAVTYPVSTGSPKILTLALDPAGKFIFLPDQTSASVSVFPISNTGLPGTLVGNYSTTLAPAMTFLHPDSASVDVAGKHLLLTDRSNGGAVSMNIAGSGSLSATTQMTTGNAPLAIIQDPGGKYVYIANMSDNAITAYTIKSTTGALDYLHPYSSTSASSLASSFRTRVMPAQIAFTRGNAAVHYTTKFAYTANASDVSTYVSMQGVLNITSTNTTAGTKPVSVAVDSAGKFAYVANYGSGDVSAYTVDKTTGALTQIVCATGCNTTTGLTANFNAAAGPNAVTVDPSGRFVYVANGLLYTIGGPVSNNVLPFSINPVSGALTRGAAVNAGSGPVSVAVDPTGQFAYVTNMITNDISAYSIDRASGALTQIACNVAAGTCKNTVNYTAGSSPVSIAIDPSGQLAYVANYDSNSVSAYKIETNGALTQINCGSGCSGVDFTAGSNPVSIAIDPTGQYVYAANNQANTVTTYTLSNANGALVQGADIATGTAPLSLATSTDGVELYATNFSTNTISSYLINAVSGVLSNLGLPVQAGTNPHSIAVTGDIQ